MPFQKSYAVPFRVAEHIGVELQNDHRSVAEATATIQEFLAPLRRKPKYREALVFFLSKSHLGLC